MCRIYPIMTSINFFKALILLDRCDTTFPKKNLVDLNYSFVLLCAKYGYSTFIF